MPPGLPSRLSLVSPPSETQDVTTSSWLRKEECVASVSGLYSLPRAHHERDAGLLFRMKESDATGPAALLQGLGIPRWCPAQSTSRGHTLKASDAQSAATDEASARVPGPQDVSSKVNRVQAALPAGAYAAAVEEEKESSGAKRTEARVIEVVPAGVQGDVCDLIPPCIYDHIRATVGPTTADLEPRI